MKTRKVAYRTAFATIALACLPVIYGMNVYGWSVSGIVVNSSGTPLSGVTVTVQDSSKYSTLTDAAGNFKFDVSTAVLSPRSNQAGSFSVHLTHSELFVKYPRGDGSIELSLINSIGRSIWAANAVLSQGVARVRIPTDLRHGVVFLQIRHLDVVEYHSVSWGPDGMHIELSSNTATTKAGLTAASVAATYPTLLFKKTDYLDTSFIMTSLNMSNVSVIMTSANTQVCALPNTLKWQSSAVLVNIKPDAKHPIVSVKDPTIQKYNGKYLIYCTVYNTKSVNGSSQGWSMQFIQFSDFSQANSATPIFMDQIPGFSGYKCAPELFYYEPKKIWYLIWQQQDPAYSTSTTPDNPSSWSAPKRFYPNGIPTNPKLPIDYFLIADDKSFYIFFTGDDGKVYRAKTTLENFPNGFAAPVIVKNLSTSIIFEASSHYKIKGTTNTYLHLVEGMGSTGRVYSAWTSEGLEGDWKDYKVGSNTPFAGKNNVTYAPGVKDWSDDVSHGELIRENPNQNQEVDPCHFQLLYQGRDPADHSGDSDYGLLPYRLGLLTAQ